MFIITSRQIPSSIFSLQWKEASVRTVSVLHQNKEYHPRRPRDFQRPEGRGNLNGGGGGFSNTSFVLVEYRHPLSINLSTGSGSILPCWRWENVQSHQLSIVRVASLSTTLGTSLTAQSHESNYSGDCSFPIISRGHGGWAVMIPWKCSQPLYICFCFIFSE